MVEELNKAIEVYMQKWQAFISERQNATFFKDLRPTAIGWKVQDLDEFNRRFEEMRGLSTKLDLTWMNERWISEGCLKTPLAHNISIIKLMQRRPNSTDAIGLDHIDFYSPAAAGAEALLDKEGLKWTHEQNGICTWTSIWFAGTEAKLRTDTVLTVLADEYKQAEQHVLAA